MNTDSYTWQERCKVHGHQVKISAKIQPKHIIFSILGECLFSWQNGPCIFGQPWTQCISDNALVVSIARYVNPGMNPGQLVLIFVFETM